ncbi:rCG44901 [Rattus norvegicus]|uniref:RCG44901 n=1 Tax=Rattus norvegicus TaxID=10116 RepID=A6KK07_RAT|nr:rCG44901 [Rattus norvegicus]
MARCTFKCYSHKTFQLSKRHIWAIKVTEITRGSCVPNPSIVPKPTTTKNHRIYFTICGTPVSSLVDMQYTWGPERGGCSRQDGCPPT